MILWDGAFSVQKTDGLEKTFYKDFWMAKNTEECQQIRQAYNDALFQFALQSIENITRYRKERWLDPIVYDFLHTPTTWLTIAAAKKLAKHLGIALVSSIHVKEKEIQSLMGNQYPWADFILEKGKETEILSDLVIAKDKSLAEEIRQNNKNCIYVGNDLDFETYEDKILLQKDPHMILYVWRISYAKWFDRFAEIIEEINKKPNRYVFTICWPLRDDGKLKTHIEKLKTYKNVYFEWQVGRVTIQDVFLNAGTYILWSRTETYNQTTMEALFYWCNVIATDVWGIKDQLSGCESGSVLPNDEHFVEHTLKLLEHMDLSYEKSSAAYQYANKKFNSNIRRKYKMDFLEKFFSK